MRERTDDCGGGRPVDLFCLACGYNVRGLSGDPRRCPECGHENVLADLEVPAKLVRKALRRLESGAALCGASAATLVWWVVPLLYVMIFPPLTPPPMYVWVFDVALAIVSLVLGVVGVVLFRRSCAGNPRWVSALLRFTLLACLIFGGGFSALMLLIWCTLAVDSMGTAVPPATVGISIGGAVVLLAFSSWLYFVARRAIRPLQRETAARFAREHFSSVE